MKTPTPILSPQSGFTLVEFLVALIIGMLVVLAAVVSLMGTRATSLTGEDVNVLQQSSARIFRMLGQQVRQAGYVPIAGPTGYYDVQASTYTGVAEAPSFFAIKGSEGGGIANDTLKIGYAPNADYAKDCIDQAAKATERIVTSEFTVNDGTLRCEGSGKPGTPQPIADGVERFDVSYGIAATPKSEQIVRYVPADPALDFNRVRTVRICLQLVGKSSVPAGGTYVDCDGESQTNSDGKLRRVYTSVFALRNNLGALPL